MRGLGFHTVMLDPLGVSPPWTAYRNIEDDVDEWEGFGS